MPKRERNDFPTGIRPGVKISERMQYSKLKNGALIAYDKGDSRDIKYIYPPNGGGGNTLIFSYAFPHKTKSITVLWEDNSIIYILTYCYNWADELLYTKILYINIENSQCGEIQTGEYSPSAIINYRGDMYFTEHNYINGEYRLRKVNGIESVAHAEELIISDNLIYSDNLVTVTWIPGCKREHNIYTTIEIIYLIELSRTREKIYEYKREITVTTIRFIEIYDGDINTMCYRFAKLNDDEILTSGKDIFVRGITITLPDEYCG